MLDYTIWKADPVFGIHFDSITLYFIMLIAVFLFLRELFSAFSVDARRSFAWAAISTIIFAIHPVHAECVAWLYARKEPLLGIFTFFSLWAFIRARTNNGWYYLLSIIMLILAALSKPTALVTPALMMIIDLALQAHKPQQGFWKKRLLLYIPMLLVVVPMLYRLITMLAGAGGIKPWHGGSIWTNLFAVSQILISYIWLIGFTVYYVADYPIALYAAPAQWQAWIFVALNILILGSAIYAFFKRNYLYTIFVSLFYIFLLPVAHFFPIAQIIADRYALLSSLSWCVLLGFGLTWLWEKRLEHPRFSPDLPRLIAIACLAVILCSYAFLTVKQNEVWRSSQRLWEHTLGRYPASSPGNVNLAVIYIEQGRYEAAEKLCINAIKALPYDYLAISNLALAQMLMGQYENAVHNYNQALKLKPDLMKAKLGLSNALWSLRRYEDLYKLNQVIIRESGPALKTESHGGVVHAWYAFAAWKLGKHEEARGNLHTAFDAARVFPQAYQQVAEVCTSMGERNMALESYSRLLATGKTLKQREEIQKKIEALNALP